VKKILLCLAASLVWSALPGFAGDPEDLAAVQQLMDKYYAVTRKAKSIEEIVPLMAKKNQDQVREKPVPAEMADMAMSIIRTSVPNTYKVNSQKVEPNKVTFELSSEDFPKEQLFPLPKGAVAKGEFIGVKEDGEWKVYKDYWVAKSADGSEKTSFGTNPDKEKEESASGKPSETKAN
jgi:hypothetical protein